MEGIQGLTRLYQEAEEILKEIERDTQEGIVVPAVNELRYAGYHLLQALNLDSSEERAIQITKAENHAKRAIYDAVEVGVLEKMGAVKRFKNDYRVVGIHDIVPGYVDKLSTIRKIQQSLNEYNMHDRAVHYQECMDSYRLLKDMAELFEDARPELNKRMSGRRTVALTTGIMIILGILTLGLQAYTSPLFNAGSDEDQVVVPTDKLEQDAQDTLHKNSTPSK